MNKPYQDALNIYKKKEYHFDSVVDHAIQKGNFVSNKNYLCCYYIVKANKIKIKKLQNCIDNPNIIYISLFAGNMNTFIKSILNKNIKYFVFRRRRKLKYYNFKRMINLLGEKNV